MAKPLALEIPARDPRAELQARLSEAPIEHAEALLSGYELLQELYDQRVLSMLRGALGSSDRIAEIGVEIAKKPEALHALRNLAILAEVLGKIDPEVLRDLTAGLPAAISAASDARKEPPPGLWQTIRLATGANVRRAVAVASAFLASWSAHGNRRKTG